MRSDVCFRARRFGRNTACAEPSAFCFGANLGQIWAAAALAVRIVTIAPSAGPSILARPCRDGGRI